MKQIHKMNKLPSPDGIHPGALKELKDEITELPRIVCSLSLHQYISIRGPQKKESDVIFKQRVSRELQAPWPVMDK